MTHKTRSLVIASTLVTIVGIGTGLVAYYTGIPGTTRASRVGPDELRYVPRDVAVIAYADVRQMVASGLHHRLQQAAPDRAGQSREFAEKTGIDVEKDVDRVVAFFEPSVGGDAAGSGMALIGGRFNESKVEQSLREHDGEVREYHGRRIIVTKARREPADADGNLSGARVWTPNELGVAFLKRGLIAAGSPELIRGAIDLERGGDNVTKNDDVMRLVRTIDQANAWAVGRFDRLRAAAPLPDGVNQLPAITWFSVSGRVSDGLTGLVRAETSDEKSASSLRDVVRGFVALARLQAGSTPAIDTFLQSLELGGSGNMVSMSFSVPPGAFDMIGPAAGGRSNHAPPSR